MNIQHYWNFFLTRTLRKKSVWIPIIAYLLLFLITFFSAKSADSFPIKDTNDFLKRSFLFQVTFFTKWFFLPSLMSWVLWWRFDDIGKETQTDGTDLFLLSTEIPTNRKKIFFGKVFFVTSFLISLHLIMNSLDVTLAWKQGVFDAYTGINIFLFIIGNFLIAPLFFFLPLFIFLFSLASLKSIWYNILKWLGVIIIVLTSISLTLLALILEKGKTEEWIEKIKDFSTKLNSNYLWIILAIMGVTISLSLITLRLAYKDYQEKDLS
jgi:hypothetical protein